MRPRTIGMILGITSILGLMSVLLSCKTSEPGGAGVCCDLKVQQIIAPSSAARGSYVNVIVYVTNLTGNATLSTTSLYLCTNCTAVTTCLWYNISNTPGVSTGAVWCCTNNLQIPAAAPLGTNMIIGVAAAMGGNECYNKKGNNTNCTTSIVITP